MSTEAATNRNDYLGMSDEDFLQINEPARGTEAEGAAPAASDAEESKRAAEATNQNDPDDEQFQDEMPEIEDETDDAPVNDEATEGGESGNQDEEEEAAEGDEGSEAVAELADDHDADDKANASSPGSHEPTAQGKEESPEKTGAADKGEAADKAADPATSAESKVDYEAFYKQIMTPFKANGRMVELKSPDEAIRLMQMGAGFGRKVQKLQSNLKILRMLEKSDLLDEDRLSYLIDINEKNPDAIKKLIKEADIDPLDINPEDNVDYRPKDHAVSDQEMAFHTALEEIQDHPTGQETLRIINQTWDQQSKSVLWDQPEVLNVIQSQRDNGVYDQIVAEIDRQKLLGHIPPHTPFLQAYKLAGDHLVQTGGFKPVAGQNPPTQNQTPQAQPQMVAKRPAQPKAQVRNSDRVSAAAPTKPASRRSSNTVINPLEMADEDFLNTFKDRL